MMSEFPDPFEEDLSDASSPLPLSPTLPPSDPFPVKNLGPLQEVTKSLAGKLQVPIEIAAHSVLAAASLATQGIADVRSPFGGTYPLSVCMLTVLSSGSRKTLVDSYALSGIRAYEQEIQATLIRQLQEKNYVDDSAPSYNPDKISMRGIHHLSGLRFEDFLRNAPYLPGSLLYESSDLSQFIGSNKGSSRLRQSQAGVLLGRLWARENVLLSHGSHVQILRGRRLALNLSIEDKLAPEVLKTDQPGAHVLLSKSLVSWPESLVGKRKPVEVRSGEILGLENFHGRLVELLRLSSESKRENFNELDPRVLTIEDPAKITISAVVEAIEEISAEDKEFGHIAGFTANCAEIICRLAGILTIYEDSDAKYINNQNLIDASDLFYYYAKQLARIQESVIVNENISDAQRLLAWLQDRCQKAHKETGVECVLQRYIQQHAHPTLRILDRLERALDVLEKHGWIYRREGRRLVCLRSFPSKTGK